MPFDRFPITLFACRCSHKCVRTKLVEVFHRPECRARHRICVPVLYTVSVFTMIFFKTRPVHAAHMKNPRSVPRNAVNGNNNGPSFRLRRGKKIPNKTQSIIALEAGDRSNPTAAQTTLRASTRTASCVITVILYFMSYAQGLIYARTLWVFVQGSCVGLLD